MFVKVELEEGTVETHCPKGFLRQCMGSSSSSLANSGCTIHVASPGNRIYVVWNYSNHFGGRWAKFCRFQHCPLVIQLFHLKLLVVSAEVCRSQWPRGLRRRSTAAHLLRSWVRIPPRAWMFVCCECCVLSGRGLYDGLIVRSEKSYRLWRVVVCDQETSKARRLKPTRGL